MTNTPSIERLKEQLKARIAQQREQGGDYMDYGLPDRLDVDLLATLETLTPSAGEVERAMSNGEAALFGIISKMHTAWMRRNELMGQQGGFELIEKMANLLDEIADDVPALWKAATASLASPPLPHPDIEGRAREMLAAACDVPDGSFANLIRTGQIGVQADLTTAIRGIVKALSLPTTEIRREALEEAANIAEAIDSGRGNEREIAKAIRSLASKEEGRL